MEQVVLMTVVFGAMLFWVVYWVYHVVDHLRELITDLDLSLIRLRADVNILAINTGHEHDLLLEAEPSPSVEPSDGVDSFLPEKFG